MTSPVKIEGNPFSSVSYFCRKTDDVSLSFDGSVSYVGLESLHIEAYISKKTYQPNGSVTLEGNWRHDRLKRFRFELHPLKPDDEVTLTKEIEPPVSWRTTRTKVVQMSHQGTLPNGTTVFMSTPKYQEPSIWLDRDLYVYTRNEDPKSDSPYKIEEVCSYSLE